MITGCLTSGAAQVPSTNAAASSSKYWYLPLVLPTMLYYIDIGQRTEIKVHVARRVQRAACTVHRAPCSIQVTVSDRTGKACLDRISESEYIYGVQNADCR